MTRRRVLRAALIGSLCALTVTTGAGAAQPGDPDPTFGGGDGRVFLEGGDRTRIVALFEDAQGRLTLAAAVGEPLGGGPVLLARLLPDGSLDPSYGEGGRSLVNLTDQSDRLFAAARTPDGGMILLAGRGIEGGFSVTRIRRDGRVDRSFGQAGTSQGSFRSRPFWGVVAIQPDGRILVSGFTVHGISTPMRRFLPGGALDRSFGEGGRLNVDNVYASSILIRTDGRFVVIGQDAGIPNGPFVVARQYSPDGVLDAGFGSDGLARVLIRSDVPSSLGTGTAAIGRGGRLIVPGLLVDPQRGRSDAIVAVMRADGGAKRTFSDDGWARLDVDRTDGYQAALVLPDGRVLLVGGTSPAATYDWLRGQGSLLVAAYRPDGVLDGSFGTDGVAITPVRRQGGYALAMAVLATPGTTFTIGGTGGGDGLVARFLLTAD